MKKVTIIVPCYNAEVVLPKTINSLVNQTYPNIEIILVNDASKDKTLEVMKRFESKYPDKIIIVDKKNNEGEDYARFSGLEKASGDYIMFCDADDWYNLNAVERLVEIKEREKVDIVYANNKRIYSQKLKITKVPVLDASFTEKKIEGEEKNKLLVSYFGANKVPVTAWGNLFDGKLFKESLKKSGLKFGADLLMSVQLFLRAHSIFVTNEVVYNYRWGGITAGYQPNFISSCRTLFERKLEYCNEFQLKEERKYTIIEMKNCIRGFVAMIATYLPKSDEENIKKIEEELKWDKYNVLEELISQYGYENDPIVKAIVYKDAGILYNLILPETQTLKARTRKLAKTIASNILKVIPL